MEPRDILIVDDDRQVREVLHQIFLAAGYNCLLAEDGREGVAMFRAARPPLTVTDLKMPVMDGIELLQQVREDRSRRRRHRPHRRRRREDGHRRA